MCIEAPLSGIPQGGCVKPPAKPVFNPGKFYHYSYFVGSTSGWCKAHDSFNGGFKDEFGLGIGGWQQWLREDSIKHFVMMSDDGVVCGSYDDADKIAEGTAVAKAFDASLMALTPGALRGDAETRRYAFHSIVAMAYNNPKAAPYEPRPDRRGAVPDRGGAGHRAPGAQHLDQGAAVSAVRHDLVRRGVPGNRGQRDRGRRDRLFFPDPGAAANKTLDSDGVSVEYTPMGQGAPQVFVQVANLAACAANAFYIEGDEVVLCPQACALLQTDKAAKVEGEVHLRAADAGVRPRAGCAYPRQRIC